MFSRFFTHRIDPLKVAEESGYECGWQGLDNQNPYKPQSPEYVAYNWGYNQSQDDADEVFMWPQEEDKSPYGEWPYSEIQ